jgi:hypothetical protein
MSLVDERNPEADPAEPVHVRQDFDPSIYAIGACHLPGSLNFLRKRKRIRDMHQITQPSNHLKYSLKTWKLEGQWP